ncbi:efflux RND transporter periplasmic adaptor subunit [Simkania sp.]|uniref:efflux RND transporter periplasmic adaptor subunit n=1 Tax=Simkania sp. TaxID=34094 RepID=UPI003B528ECD
MRYAWLFLTAVFLIGCEKKEIQEEVRPVLTEKVELFEGNPPLIFSGFAKSQKFINVSFRVGGLIEKLPINVGDRLKQGEMIASLDEDDFLLRLQKAGATLDKATAQLRQSSAHYKRIKTLYESESASRDELDTARASYESARAAVEQSESEYDLSQKELSYTFLRAENNGCEVAEKHVEVNENIEPGQQIATLTCGTTLEVEIAIPESSIADIQQGDPVDVYFNTLPDEPFKGFVSEVGVSATEGATFPVTIALENQDPRLRSGMAVKAFIPRPYLGEKDIIIAPLEAVGEDQKGHFVYIFQDEGKGVGVAKKIYVKIGELLPQGIVIKSGLKPDQELIIAGLRYLADGRRVKRLKDTRMFEKKRT